MILKTTCLSGTQIYRELGNEINIQRKGTEYFEDSLSDLFPNSKDEWRNDIFAVIVSNLYSTSEPLYDGFDYRLLSADGVEFLHIRA